MLAKKLFYGLPLAATVIAIIVSFAEQQRSDTGDYEALIKQTHSSDEKIRAQAYVDLLEYGDDGFPHLAQALVDEAERIREYWSQEIYLLHKYRKVHPKIIERSLCSILVNGRNIEGKILAAQLLAKIRSKSAQVDASLEQGLNSTNIYLNTECLRAFVRIGSAPENAITKMKTLLDSQDIEVKIAAASALAKCFPDERHRMTILLDAYFSNNDIAKRHAYYALILCAEKLNEIHLQQVISDAEHGQTHSIAILGKSQRKTPNINNLLCSQITSEHASTEVKIESIIALVELGYTDNHTREVILNQLNNGCASIQVAAFRALVQLGHNNHASEFVQGKLQQGNAFSCLLIEQCMVYRQEFVSMLLAQIDRHNLNFQSYASKAICEQFRSGCATHPELILTLETLTQHPNKFVRYYARSFLEHTELSVARLRLPLKTRGKPNMADQK